METPGDGRSSSLAKSGEIKLTAEFSPLKIQSDAGTIDGTESVNQGTESNVHVRNKGTLFDLWC